MPSLSCRTESEGEIVDESEPMPDSSDEDEIWINELLSQFGLPAFDDAGAAIIFLVGPLALVVLRILVASAAGGLLGSFQESVVRAAVPSRRSLLQPSRHASAAEVMAAGRIPVAPRLKKVRRRGIWRRLRYLVVRPSSPKPVFLIDSFEETHGTQLDESRDQLKAGGHRFVIKLHKTESARHLVYSLRTGSPRRPRDLMICGLGDYLNEKGEARHFVIDRRYVKSPRDAKDTVIAFDMDPIFATRPHGTKIKHRKAPEDAFWLVKTPETESDTEVARNEAESETSDVASGHPALAYGASYERTSMRAILRDPFRGPRRVRYVGPALLLAAGAAVVWAATSLDPRDSSYETWVAVMVGCSMFLSWIGLSILSAHLVNYWYLEKCIPSSWTASTTRCIADDIIRRNGIRRRMPRRSRYRTEA